MTGPPNHQPLGLCPAIRMATATVGLAYRLLAFLAAVLAVFLRRTLTGTMSALALMAFA